MKIFELFGSVNLNDNITQNLQNINQQVNNTSNQMKVFGVTITDGMKTAGIAAAAFAGGVIAVGAGMLKMANDAADVAGRITDMSTKMGISTDMFQEWVKA